MVRVWALFFVVSFSVAFLIHRPSEEVAIPHSKEFPVVPGDVFWYHLNEHFIMIILSIVMLSFFRWPAKPEHYTAFATFFFIQIVDVILYRMFYRNWPIEFIPWNVVKVSIQGLVTILLQAKAIWTRIQSIL